MPVITAMMKNYSVKYKMLKWMKIFTRHYCSSILTHIKRIVHFEINF